MELYQILFPNKRKKWSRLYNLCLVARYVLGHDAMRKMGKSNVLISGMKGLGVEIGE